MHQEHCGIRQPGSTLSAFREELRDAVNLPFRITSLASWLGDSERVSAFSLEPASGLAGGGREGSLLTPTLPEYLATFSLDNF